MEGSFWFHATVGNVVELCNRSTHSVRSKHSVAYLYIWTLLVRKVEIKFLVSCSRWKMLDFVEFSRFLFFFSRNGERSTIFIQMDCLVILISYNNAYFVLDFVLTFFESRNDIGVSFQYCLSPLFTVVYLKL